MRMVTMLEIDVPDEDVKALNMFERIPELIEESWPNADVVLSLLCVGPSDDGRTMKVNIVTQLETTV